MITKVMMTKNSVNSEHFLLWISSLRLYRLLDGYKFSEAFMLPRRQTDMTLPSPDLMMFTSVDLGDGVQPTVTLHRISGD